MRQLTALEMELISGGNNSATEVITIVGSPPDDIGDDPSIPPPSGDDGNYGGGSGDFSEMLTEIQAEAKDLAAKIISDPKHNHEEMIAFIYRDANGNIVESEILKNVDASDPNSDQNQIKDLVNEIGADNIVGMIHNHDEDDYGDNAYDNEMPSENDHNTAINIDKLNDDLPFENYIIDPDNDLRGYTTSNDSNPTSVLN